MAPDRHSCRLLRTEDSATLRLIPSRLLASTVGGLGLFVAAVAWTPASASAQQAETEAFAFHLADEIAKSGRKKVVVLDFVGPEAEVTELGQWLAEEVSAALGRGDKQLSVIDRARLQAVAVERKLTSKGTLDPMSSLWVGELVGAKAVVTGLLHSSPDGLRLSLVVWDVDKQIRRIADATESLPRTREVEERLSKRLRSAVPKGSSLDVASVRPTTPSTGSRGLSPSQSKAPGRPFVEVLDVAINEDGRATDIHLVRGVGYGFDEKAVEIVQTWRFPKPPVARPARTLIEIEFRLLPDSHKPQ